ncbi:hydrolase [Gemmobacter lanyuensis]|uniref:Hydrolase n=1 Tax=Gemmobacter lanyuensis TaxID=1054497 RepID=A0A918IVC3_9RHOB|nr:HAD family phosphatase [Gemmobacter lanyuensis]GGW33661.1 hydrolase [Gemmobacter lanyuensis]
MIPAAVLFDCDGVVIDSEPPTFDLLAEDLSQRGLTLSHAEMERLFLGGTIERVGKIARELGGDIPNDWVPYFYDRLYARLAEGAPLIPGVLGVFEALDAAGVPYAIGSNGTGRKMEITIGQHPDLARRLQGRLFSGVDLKMLKPAPDLYLHAARALGADPARCVVIEDSATGARAARAAGMRCMGYAPTGATAALLAEGAEPFARMADLPGLLGL